MKKFTSLIVALFIVTGILAQAPAQFKYQAVLRDADGQIMANEDVTLDISILRSDVSGSSVFDEQHIVTTTELGVINLDIGSVSDLSTVDWGADSYFIEISVNGTVMGTSQILSVPYALYAEKTGLWQKNGDTVYYNNGKVGIGTASPDVNLHIFDNERPWLKIETGGANMWALSELATPENVFQFSLLGNDVTGGGAILRGTANINAIAPGGLNIFNEDSSHIAFFTKGYDTLDEKVRISPEGQIGIGTRDPDSDLHIFDDIPSLELETDMTDKWAISELRTPNNLFQFSLVGTDASGGGVILSNTANIDVIAPGGLNIINEENSHIAFLLNGYAPSDEKMRITSAGNVGIGTDSPGEKLVIEGAFKVGDGGYTGIRDGADLPVPAGGAGTIIFLDTHFFGWDGMAWQQLD